jgi:glucoamylase
LTLIHFSNSLIQRGQIDVVRRNLYDGLIPADTVIKADLEYVAHHWNDLSFDLWEEVKGHHFYTRMVQRRALIEGALLADELGDSAAAGFYRQQAQLISIEIEKHWSSSQQILLATLDAQNQPGCRSKDSGLDVAVVLGALHGCVGDGFLCPGSDQVLITAERLRSAFDGIYRINQVAQNRAGEAVGSAIGRYPEDCYDGVTTNGTAGAWFLATHAFAELYYRAAHEWQALGSFQVTTPKYDLIRRAGVAVALGETITSSDPRFAQILSGLQALGDAELRRSMLHSDAQGSMSEQMNGVSGYMQSARDLSWSYSSFLTAVWAR